MPTLQEALIPELVKGCGAIVICGAAYLILYHQAPLGAFLPGIALLLHGCDLGIVLWLPKDPPSEPPPPYKPTPSPLHPQGLVFSTSYPHW